MVYYRVKGGGCKVLVINNANDLVDKKKVLSHIVRLNYIVEGYQS